MRILHFSDLHLDTQFQALGEDQARLRRERIRSTLRNICNEARMLNVDVVTCAGDLYEHERISPDTEEFLRSTFEALSPIPVFISPGNHDWYGPESAYARIRWSSNVHVFTETTLTPVELRPGFTLWGAAHRAPANTPGFVRNFRVQEPGVHIGLFHGSANSQFAFEEKDKVLHAPFDDRELEQSGLHHSLIGHFHKQSLQPLYTYPGNPEPLSFGETAGRGAVLLTIDDSGQFERQVIEVASSQVHDVVVDLTGITHSSEIIERTEFMLRGLKGHVRVTLKGEIPSEVDVRADVVQAQLRSGFDALIVRNGKLVIGFELEEIANEPTVRGQFVRDVQADPDLDDELRRRIIVTGLRAFAGRQDLEVL